MALADLTDWLDEFLKPGRIIFAKRLSGNDTLANGSHQAGPYIPKEFLFRVIPAINRTDILNPDAWFDLAIDSHPDFRKVRAIYYNNRFHGKPKGGRNEARLTNFGGAASPLLDPDSTGAVALFSFRRVEAGEQPGCHVWIARHATEEDLIEDRIGPVEPGRYVVWTADVVQPDLFRVPERPSCWLADDEIPEGWKTSFPPGTEIVRKAVELRPCDGLEPDARLLRRLACEYEIFQSVEHAIELPAILRGFESLDAFLKRAQTILQRRKARAGRSLELQTREILIEERLIEGTHFSHQPESDPGKRPDFLFPSQAAYQNPGFPDSRLRMLAVKTTCRDRWRQVLNEADRIRRKHLLTLQEGVSEGQFREMHESGVQLVVPSGIIRAYPDAVQPHLQTLESFIGDVRLL
ncbi:type II restriction endonuclease [Altererythrobacter lauratis]|uniref:Type II restriction endonuclease n=1 Tax=Alteraurantiacibacter lauratis TaxID=2054627 RepID=A0ABV7EGW7_9SPHN